MGDFFFMYPSLAMDEFKIINSGIIYTLPVCLSKV